MSEPEAEVKTSAKRVQRYPSEKEVSFSKQSVFGMI